MASLSENSRNCVRSTVVTEKEQQNFEFVNALCFGGRKDATQMIAQGPNSKYYRSVQREEHYTVVGEPGIISLIFLRKIAKAQLLQKRFVLGYEVGAQSSNRGNGWYCFHDREMQWLHSWIGGIVK